MSKNTRKTSYDIYPLISLFFQRQVRQNLPKKERKDITEKGIFNGILMNSPEMANTLDFMIAAEEYFWKRTGRNAIFPENAAVIDNLLRAKYQMETSEGFELPFEAFLFAIPKGYTFEGVEVPSFLVTMINYEDFGDTVIQPFCKYVDFTLPMEIMEDEEQHGKRCMAVSFQDKSQQMYQRLMQIEDRIPAILASKTTDEFREASGSYVNKIGILESDEDDVKIQSIVMRLIAALGVYHMATEGDRLREGFPGTQAPKLYGPKEAFRVNHFTLKGSERKANASPDAHYRSWHFRQLRDERYYRGEHESKPRGSRYSFVSDTLVGQKVTPHTVE